MLKYWKVFFLIIISTISGPNRFFFFASLIFCFLIWLSEEPHINWWCLYESIICHTNIVLFSLLMLTSLKLWPNKLGVLSNNPVTWAVPIYHTVIYIYRYLFLFFIIYIKVFFTLPKSSSCLLNVGPKFIEFFTQFSILVMLE